MYFLNHSILMLRPICALTVHRPVAHNRFRIVWEYFEATCNRRHPSACVIDICRNNTLGPTQLLLSSVMCTSKASRFLGPLAEMPLKVSWTAACSLLTLPVEVSWLRFTSIRDLDTMSVWRCLSRMSIRKELRFQIRRCC